MISYKIDYILDNEEKSFIIGSEEEVVFSIKYREERQSKAFYLVLNHTISKVSDNILHRLYDAIGKETKNIRVTFIDELTKEENLIFTASGDLVELDVELNRRGGFETVMRIF